MSDTQTTASVPEAETAEDKAFFEQERQAEFEAPAPEPVTDAPKATAEAPVEAADPAPEAAVDAKDAGPAPMIPKARLDEVIGRAKAAEERAARVEQLLSTLVERGVIPNTQARQPAAADAPALPDPNTDPLGYALAVADQARTYVEQQQNRERQTQAFNQFATALTAKEAEFRASAPDYDAAVEFAKGVRDQELQALGYGDPQVRRQIITNEVIQIGSDALRNGANPAERFYAYAKVRGYAPAAAQAPAAQPNERIAAIAQGQKTAARSPSAAVGAGNQNPLSLEALSAMSDEDFDRHFEKVWRQAS